MDSEERELERGRSLGWSAARLISYKELNARFIVHLVFVLCRGIKIEFCVISCQYASVRFFFLLLGEIRSIAQQSAIVPPLI